MSTNEQTPLSQPTSAVRNMLGKEQVPQDLGGPASNAALRKYCGRNYHQFLLSIAEKVYQEKVHQEKLKAVQARLNFEEASQHSDMSGNPEPRHDHSDSPKKRDPERKTVFKRLEKGVFHRLKDKGKKLSLRETEVASEKHHNKRSPSRRMEALSESECSAGGHWKSKSMRQKSSIEDDLSQPWEVGQKQNFKKGGFRNQQRKGQVAGNTDGTTMAEGSQTKDYPNLLFEASNLFFALRREDGMRGPMIIEAEMEGHCVHRIYVDECSSSEILYEHCFNRFFLEIGDEEHSTSTWMNFMVVRSHSSYNGIIGRTRVRRIRVVPSTAHGMLKFPVIGRTVTLWSSRFIPLECTMVSGSGVPQPVINQVTEEKIQIGWNLEVYVDDLVIKIRTEQKVIRDVEKTFKPLREINMKLNPKKCTFEMKEGTFLGYKVNADGLKVCPDKVEAVLSLPSPKCLKDVQRLSGKLRLSIYKEAKTAFKQIKKLIAELPMLTTLEEKEELIIYLAAVKEAISAVLMTKRDRKQMSVYFVIRALQGSEINYTPMEKLILAMMTLRIQPMENKEELSDPWILFTDRSSCIDGSGAGQILTSSKGMEFTYALRFRFDATNNEAEYEALIAGLDSRTNGSKKSPSKCKFEAYG
nr:reverse transcriptase domain-containing protein [Tanacetum cinerariifolium]